MIQSPAKSLARVRGRGLLLSILEKEAILTRINILDDGCFTVETTDWDSYWRPLRELNHKKLDDCLCALHITWRRYIQSDFDSILRQEFCFRYFSLLSGILAAQLELDDAPWLNVLHTVLGIRMLWNNFFSS
jgi:hypothetical protein